MLIKLSSDNETDPTKFSNNFSEGMIIKPFSKVCLIKGQITRIDQGQKLDIQAGTIINVRFSPYDIIQLTLNPTADTIYTIKEFCEYVHILLPDNTSWNRGAQFVDVSKDLTTNADLEFRFYFTGVTPNLQTFLYNNVDYKRLYLAEVNGRPMPRTGPGNLGAGNNQTQIGGGTGDYAVGVAWNPAKYTPPPNQINKDAMNMIIEGQAPLTRTTWIIGQPDLKNLKITFGNATHDGTNYTVAPIVGTDPYANPGANWGNMILDISFLTDGTYNIDYFNASTNNMEQVVTGGIYNPGDIWELSGVGSGILIDPDRYMYLNSYVKRGNGLAYWIPGKTALDSGDTAMTLNEGSGVGYTLTLEQFYTTHINQGFMANLLRFDDLAMNTTWLATGYRYTAGIGTDNSGEPQANSEQKANGGCELISNGLNDVVQGLTGEVKAWVNNAFFLERWTIGAVAGAISDKNAVCALDLDGIPLTTPFYIGFFFRPGDDTSKLPAGQKNNMAVLGSEEDITPILAQISIGNVDDWDLKYWEADGAVIEMELRDGGDVGNRINITLNTNYHFSMCYMGTGVGTGQGQLIFRMYDIDNDVLYYKDSLMLGATGLPPLKYLGGINPTENVNFGKWSCAYYSEFRLYQKCSNVAGHTVNLWDNIQTEMQTYWKTGDRTVEWFWGGEGDNATILPSAGMKDTGGGIKAEYLVAGLPRPETTITQFFQRPDLVDSTDDNWYDVLNCYSPGCTYLPNADRITTLDADAYAGNQCGFVDTSSILNELDFINPTIDAEDNVLVTRTNRVAGNGENNPSATLVMDLENTVLQHETINIEIPNLPHRTYNGTNSSIDKTIYQMPLLNHSTAIDNLEILEVIPATKVWLELNNPGEIPLNRLDVQLSDVFGKKLNQLNYSQPTNIVIEIKNNDDVIN